MPAINKQLENAVAHHRSGRVNEAEVLYREILRTEPAHTDALHLLGVAAHQRRRHEEAVRLISRSIELGASTPTHYCNLGAAQQSLGNLDRAIDCFRKAIAQQPDFAGAHYNLAIALEKARDSDEALDAYREAVRLQPDYADAWNNLGNLHKSRDESGQAVDAFQKALQIHPGFTHARYNLANTLLRRGECVDAIEQFRRVVRQAPDFTAARMNLGQALAAAGRSAEALSVFSEILDFQPDNVEVLNNLAQVHRNQGRFEAARDVLEQALRIDPKFAPTFANLGNVHLHLRDPGRAVDCQRQALDIDPRLLNAHLGLGDALLDRGDHDEAADAFRSALRLDPDNEHALLHLASIDRLQRRLADAARAYRAIFEKNPDCSSAYVGLGRVFRDQLRMDEALECFTQAIAVDPADSKAWNMRGLIHYETNRFESALECFNEAIRLNPAHGAARLNRGLVHLITGNFADGWPDYEYRWQCDGVQPRHFVNREWKGEPIGDLTVLAYSEQGVGDELMFASAIPELASRAGRCILECDPRLVPLFARSFPNVHVFPKQEPDGTGLPLAEIDLQVAIGSLPRYCPRWLETETKPAGYLVADADRKREWVERLAALGPEPKIGISWRGGKDTHFLHRKSTLLKHWGPLFRHTGVTFINLQYGECRAELARAAREQGVAIHDWPDADPLADLDGFASQVAALDLVISTANSTVHMAGALGVPTWLLVPHAPDWRWLVATERSPWYRQVRLFRQQQLGVWPELFERVGRELERVLSEGNFQQALQRSSERAVFK